MGGLRLERELGQVGQPFGSGFQAELSPSFPGKFARYAIRSRPRAGRLPLFD